MFNCAKEMMLKVYLTATILKQETKPNHEMDNVGGKLDCDVALTQETNCANTSGG